MRLLPVVTSEPALALIHAVGWAIVIFVGQGLLAGVVVVALMRALRGRSADLRYGVACAGLLVMAVSPVVTAAWDLAAGRGEMDSRSHAVALLPPGVGHAVAVAPLRAAGAVVAKPGSFLNGRGADVITPRAAVAATPAAWPAWRKRVETWLPTVVAGWLAGVCVLALRLVNGLVEVRCLTHQGLIEPTNEILTAISQLVNRAGLRRPVICFLSLMVDVPTVVGWLRPQVLIPMKSLTRLTLQQLEALLAHEIAHIRRHDYLVNILQVTAEALLFFHPAVWWISGRIRVERENCCDDMAVVLCGGDRRLLARALFAMEEQRGAPMLRVAATGGSLRDRVRRLVVPGSGTPYTVETGWAGVCLIVVVGLITVAWLATGSTNARDDAPRSARASVSGRVLDEGGKPVVGVRVRLYRRDGRWERRHPVIEEATSGPDGSFRLSSSLEPLPESRSRGLPPYVLLADCPGKAVGWRTIPNASTKFTCDMIITEPVERLITVVDAASVPITGAKVVAYGLGDPSSASPPMQEVLEGLRPDDGPLTATTDTSGHATFRQLPRAVGSFLATKHGFAQGHAFREKGTIRLTPSAGLAGTVTGPDGEPLGGIKVVLFTTFMWAFEHAVTDAKGRYQFEDLKARGWDMSAWGPDARPGNGRYKVWIENDRFAVPTRTVTLEPNARETLDLPAEKAGVIRVTVTEEGNGMPMGGVRIWGFDQATGSSSRFNAYTDGKGRATFYSTPEKIWLGITGPPEGYYVEGDLGHSQGASKQFEFAGGSADVRLVMPRIAGPLITVSGTCTCPDGSPAAGAGVSAAAAGSITSRNPSSMRMRRADGTGHFTLEGVPAGRTLPLYAETEDRKFAGTATVLAPGKAAPDFRVTLALTRTLWVELVVHDKKGEPLPSRKFHIAPQVANVDFPSLRRDVESDEDGQIRLDGIVPGLSYRIQEDVPTREGPVAVVGGRPPWYNEVLVLVPKTGK
jgi:beta-lactamase regulating signal transducer with metallopeptidase domain